MTLPKLFKKAFSMDFDVHSAGELDTAIKFISRIEGVDEVYRVDIEN